MKEYTLILNFSPNVARQVLWLNVMFPPTPQIHVLNSQCDGVWRWGLWVLFRLRCGHGSGSLMMELVPFRGGRETQALGKVA